MISNRVKYIIIGVFVVVLGIAWAIAAKVEGKDIGETCEANRNDCNGEGGDCLIPKSGAGYCSVPCNQDSDCPKKWTCGKISVDTYSGQTGEKVKESSARMCLRP